MYLRIPSPPFTHRFSPRLLVARSYRIPPKHVTAGAQTPALTLPPRPFDDREEIKVGIKRCGTCASIESWGLVKLAVALSQMLSLFDAGDSLSLSPSDMLSLPSIKETRGRLFPFVLHTETFVPHTMWKIRVQSCGAIDTSYSVLRVWLSPVRIALTVSCAFLLRSVPYEAVLAVWLQSQLALLYC
jgi:hypothetical protein